MVESFKVNLGDHRTKGDPFEMLNFHSLTCPYAMAYVNRSDHTTSIAALSLLLRCSGLMNCQTASVCRSSRKAHTACEFLDLLQ